MAGSLIVEVLTAGGEVSSRTRIHQLPALVGRAYESDVILDDPYVSPRHLRLSLNDGGELMAEDLGSVNGTVAQGTKASPAQPFTVASGAVLRLGRTSLRVMQPDHPVAESPRDEGAVAAAPRSRSAHGARAVALLVTAVAVAILAVDSHLGTWERETTAAAVGTGLTLLLALMVWAGLWSLVGRLVVSRFRFVEHLTVIAVAAAAMTLMSTAAEWIEFVGPASGVSDFVSIGGGLLLASTLLFAHLSLATAASRRSLVQGTLGVSLGIASVFAFIAYAERDEFSAGMSYSGTLKPLDARWLRPISVEEFTSDAGKLKTEVDKMASQASR